MVSTLRPKTKPETQDISKPWYPTTSSVETMTHHHHPHCSFHIFYSQFSFSHFFHLHLFLKVLPLQKGKKPREAAEETPIRCISWHVHIKMLKPTCFTLPHLFTFPD